MNRHRAAVWKTRPTSLLCCVWRERDDDAIMKGGKAAMKLKIKQKKHLSVLRVGLDRKYKAVIFWSGVDLQCEDVGE